MNKNKKLACLSLLFLSPVSMAMQPMDDQSLSAMTGQDGLTIGVQANVQFNQMAIIDNDGLSYGGYTAPSYTNRAGLVIAGVAGQSTATPVKVTGLNGTAETILGFKAVIDTDAGSAATGDAFANIALAFNNNVTGLRISPFSIYTAGPGSLSSLNGSTYTRNSIFSSGTLLKSDVKELLRVGGIDIVFAANKPSMNIQLGAAPQGHMVMFDGAIESICGTGTGCNIMLVSDYATPGNSTTAPVGASFDFKLTGNNGNPFGLKGFYAGIYGPTSSTDKGGVIFGNTGTSNKFDLQLNNVLLGTNGDRQASAFNNLPNASIGNIGMTGASVTNLKMKVSGM
ncbi:hypothetical protein F971_01579 [Acinetobacter vivianii]|uniref:DUF6160 domain-containing protein n=1 Tax=Acinetobacter vivianii TaxID=1776742 RepID=N8UYH0_9GAMM|nr:DUF6160 family protein [Acinetobacter vivianii]ENU92596.1 hypothetical protein F971_01579 [Acinetobacter vivianii]